MFVRWQTTAWSWRVSCVLNRRCLIKRFWSATGGSTWTVRPRRACTIATYPSARAISWWKPWHSSQHTKITTTVQATRAKKTVHEANESKQRFTRILFRYQAFENWLVSKCNYSSSLKTRSSSRREYARDERLYIYIIYFTCSTFLI